MVEFVERSWKNGSRVVQTPLVTRVALSSTRARAYLLGR
jgi:hypothetical protein